MKTSSYIWTWNKFSFLQSAITIRFVFCELCISQELVLCFCRHKGLIGASACVKVLFEGICCTFNSVHNTYLNQHTNTSYSSYVSFLIFSTKCRVLLWGQLRCKQEKIQDAWFVGGVDGMFLAFFLLINHEHRWHCTFVHSQVHPQRGLSKKCNIMWIETAMVVKSL